MDIKVEKILLYHPNSSDFTGNSHPFQDRCFFQVIRGMACRIGILQRQSIITIFFELTLVFTVFLLPQTLQKLGVPIILVQSVILVQFFIVLVLFVVNFTGTNFKNNISAKVLNILLVENIVCLVPKTYFLAYCLNKETQQSPIKIVDIFYIVYYFLILLGMGLYLKFKVVPFRNKTLWWNFNNDRQFYNYLLNIMRVAVIYFDGLSITFLTISFTLELFLRKMTDGYLTKEARTVQDFCSNFCMAYHLGLLGKYLPSNANYSIQVMGFLFFMLIVNGIISIYALSMPEKYFPLCELSIDNYYNFYFQYKGNVEKGITNIKQFSMQNDQQGMKTNPIISTHLLNCTSEYCNLVNAQFDNIAFLEDLELLCEKMISEKQSESKKCELLKQFWLFETGKKIKFRMTNKELESIQDFIIFYANNLMKYEDSQTSTTSSSEISTRSFKSNFYDKFMDCLQSFSNFYEQVAKSKPNVEIIVQLGTTMQSKTQEVSQIYSKLLKNNSINFQTAEIFIQFQRSFISEDELSEQKIQRLKKIQMSKDLENIEEIYLPSLAFYPETGYIDSMNAQCLSFFRLSRFEIKAKTLGSLIYPPLESVKSLRLATKSDNGSKIYTFFTRGDEIVYGSVSFRQFTMQSKKLQALTIQKIPFTNLRNLILIKKETYEIQAMQRQQTFLKINQGSNKKILLKWRQLYEDYFMQKVDELMEHKIVKVEIQKFGNVLFAMTLEECLHGDYCIVSIRLIKQALAVQIRVSSFLASHQYQQHHQNIISNHQSIKTFSFTFDTQYSENEAHLYGCLKQKYQSLNKNKNQNELMPVLQRGISNMLVASTLIAGKKFSQGIKTYRLIEGDLYNIDLEDKEQYAELCDNQKFKKNKMLKPILSRCALYTLLCLSIILMVGCSVFYYTMVKVEGPNLLTKHMNYLRTQQVRLHMNRFAAIFLSVEKGRYDSSGDPNLNWRRDLKEVYDLLKILRAEDIIFPTEELNINYRNITYQGSLNEIIDVMVAHVYEVSIAQTIKLSELQFFSSCYISVINPLIHEAKNSIDQYLVDFDVYYSKLRLIVLILGISFIVLYYVSVFLMVKLWSNEMMEKLDEFMFISDAEARMYQNSAEKLKFAVEMTKKNIDIDLKTVMGPKQKHKKRKNPKQMVFSLPRIIIKFILPTFLFAYHIFDYVNMTDNMTQMIDCLQQCLLESQQLTTLYSGMVESVNRIDSLGSNQQKAFDKLSDSMRAVLVLKGNYFFTLDINEYIDYVFYQNSCQYLVKNEIFSATEHNCSMTLPKYEVQNPFQLGLTAYLTKVYHKAEDNITQVYGSTSMYSHTFAKVYDVLLKDIKITEDAFINTKYFQMEVDFAIHLALCGIYVIINFLLGIYTKFKFRQIESLLDFVNISKFRGKNQELSKKKITQQQLRNNSNEKNHRDSSLNQSSKSNQSNQSDSEDQGLAK